MDEGQPDARLVGDWVAAMFGVRPVAELFRIVHLSAVYGLHLSDGRQIVVKVRPGAERIGACVAVQRHLWEAGFPCAQPLAGPAPLGGQTATAETMLHTDSQADPGPQDPARSAEALAWLVTAAPPAASLTTLEPPPTWVWWRHREPGTWPWPDDRDADLNAAPGPVWLDELGRRVRERLAAYRGVDTVGHCDWEVQNVMWSGSRLHAVHDWDSVVRLPEAAIAGAAAAVFAAPGGTPGEAQLSSTAHFLQAYERARGLIWDADDREAAWAAGLWVRAFNAKKAALDPNGHVVGERLRSGAAERLRRAGA